MVGAAIQTEMSLAFTVLEPQGINMNLLEPQ